MYLRVFREYGIPVRILEQNAMSRLGGRPDCRLGMRVTRIRTALIGIVLVAVVPRIGEPQDSVSVPRARRDSVFATVTFREYLRGMVGPRSVLRGVGLAGFDQWRRRPRSLPETWRGFEDRLGARYGQVAISHTLRFGASRILDERTLRYWPCECGESESRLLHALAGPYRVVSPGGIHSSWLNPATELVSGVLVTSVRPGGLRVGEGIRNGATALVGESLVDVVREFWPWGWRPPYL
jgi:hypothetical protein